MKNNITYKFWQKIYPKVSVSVKVSAICGIGSIGIGEYPGIGIGGNFGIGAALLLVAMALQWLEATPVAHNYVSKIYIFVKF